MLKVLSGLLKNMKLSVPKSGTRPTSVLLRRRLFDQYIDWSEYTFIDLCAGAGSISIEALSRGCQELIVVENNKKAYEVLRENFLVARQRVEQQGIEGIDIKFMHLDFQKMNLKLKTQFETRKVIIFLDPPYENTELYKSFFENFQWLSDDSQIWVESDSLKGISESTVIDLCSFIHRKTYIQGSKFVACFTGERK